MKNVANYISFSRIIMSVILIFTETFSIFFYIIYIYCGISDMLDGFIARKCKNESKIGAKLDSIADLIFVFVAIAKIFLVLNLSNLIVIWVIIIVLIKIVNVIYSYIHYKKIELPHTVFNKITGFILFISPLVIIYTNSILLEIIICIVATFSAIHEGFYIKIKNKN